MLEAKCDHGGGRLCRATFASSQNPARLVASIPTSLPRLRQRRLSSREQSLPAFNAVTNRNRS
jgi:hypothetical protein